HQIHTCGEVGAIGGVEIGGGQLVVGAVLDPEHQGGTRGDDDITRLGGPHRGIGVDELILWVQVIEGVVGEIHWLSGGVGDLDELIGIGTTDIVGVGQQLGENERYGRGGRGEPI